MRAALYVRVSTDEQAKTGYSIADQLRELRHHAGTSGYEIVGELVDDGYSGASPNRPGLLRAEELAEEGAIDVVLSTKRDRLFRSRLQRLLMDQVMEDCGVKLVSLNDTNNRIGDGVQDDYAEWERETFMERSRSGKRQRAREGKVVPAGDNLPYGFRYNADRTNYLPDDATMPVVRRIFEEVSRGTKIIGLKKLLDAEGVPTPGGSPFWNPITIKRILEKDLYKPHTHEELAAAGVGADVLEKLDPEKGYGIWWFGKDRVKGRTRGRTRKDGEPRSNASDKPRGYKRQEQDEWIPVPIPLEGTGIQREWVDAARAYLKTTRGWRAKPGRRYFELRGMVHCDACGGSMTSYHNSGYYYYSCIKRRNHGRKACPDSHNLNAARAEDKVMRDVSDVLQAPERVFADLDAAIAKETATVRNPDSEVGAWLRVIEDCDKRRGKYQEMFAADVMSLDELKAKLQDLDAQRAQAEEHLARAREGQGRVEDLRTTRKTMLEAYASGILYDGIEHFSPEMRHEIYGALGLHVTVESDGTMRVDYNVDANVVRLTREVEGYAAEVEEYRGKLLVRNKKHPVPEPVRASSS